MHLLFLFFFNVFINLNWRLITLPYCGGFCHTLTWISHGCTCVPQSRAPPPSPSHPSGLSQCTGFECPVSYIELGLVIYFTNMVIYMFQCYSLKSSQPAFSPRLQNLFFISVSFSVTHIRSSFYIPYYALIYCIGAFLSDLLHYV